MILHFNVDITPPCDYEGDDLTAEQVERWLSEHRPDFTIVVRRRG